MEEEPFLVAIARALAEVNQSELPQERTGSISKKTPEEKALELKGRIAWNGALSKKI